VIILLFFQSGGLLLFYKVEQHIQQSKMSRITEQANSVSEHFIIPRDVFAKSRISEKEISVYGKLYDLKSFTILGNAVEIFVIRDKAEELILKAINNVMKSGSEQDAGILAKIAKLLSLDYTLPLLLPDSVLAVLSENTFSILRELIYSRIGDILTPPPETL
jgi:hypothetical protein